MEVKWLDYVKDDFKDFIKNAHEGTEETALKYVKKVVRETESILSSNVGINCNNKCRTFCNKIIKIFTL